MKTLILLLSFVFCVLARAGETSHQSVLAYDGLSQIILSAGEGGLWCLSIRKDGSGLISWANSPTDQSKFPAKTFDFEQVYHTLAPQALPHASYTDLFTMSLREGDDINVSTYHFKQGEAVLALFGKAMHDCDQKDRMAEVWQRHSPLVKP